VGFTLERTYRVLGEDADSHHEALRVRPDADGLGLVSLTMHDASNPDGPALATIVMVPMAARLVADALRLCADEIERCEGVTVRDGAADGGGR
jgi:hypothetical protein